MKTALLGCGKAGQSLLKELIANSNISRIEVFDPDVSKYSDLYKTRNKNILFSSDTEKFRPEYDLVVIATPDHLHTAYLLAAIENGIDCFVEKPLVTNWDDFYAIEVALSKQPNLKISSNFILRAAPLFRDLKLAYAAGFFGDKVSVEGKYLYGRWEKLVNGWRGDLNYSVILGGLIHLVDLFCFITNNFEYESHVEYKRLTNQEPFGVKDFGSVSLSNEKIGVANLSTNFSTPLEHRRDFSIYGDQGWVEVRGSEVSVGGKLLDYNMKNLSAKANIKGELLQAFIGDIVKGGQGSSLYPTRKEMLEVVRICLSNFAA
jgi:predicted dehydrogenase